MFQRSYRRYKADIDDVIQGLGLDPRIGTNFLQPGAGYGSPCLTKDARVLKSLASNKGYDFKLLRVAIEVNTRQCALMVEMLKQLLGSFRDKEIALLGLAFKPSTDDFMGTSQSKYSYAGKTTTDGNTWFFGWDNGDPLYDYTSLEPVTCDGCHGMRLFTESRGYTV
jgi:hypothetical protein